MILSLLRFDHSDYSKFWKEWEASKKRKVGRKGRVIICRPGRAVMKYALWLPGSEKALLDEVNEPSFGHCPRGKVIGRLILIKRKLWAYTGDETHHVGSIFSILDPIWSPKIVIFPIWNAKLVYFQYRQFTQYGLAIWYAICGFLRSVEKTIKNSYLFII